MRARSYSLAAVLTMAVGLAATTAVVAVTNAVLLRPLPYPNPDRLFSARMVCGRLPVM